MISSKEIRWDGRTDYGEFLFLLFMPWRWSCFASIPLRSHLLYGGIDLGSENKSARSSASCTLLFDGMGSVCVLKWSLCINIRPRNGRI